jgi:hypothetical protein
MNHASAASRVRSCIGAVVLATVCLLMMGIARADAATITVTGGATATTQFVNAVNTLNATPGANTILFSGSNIAIVPPAKVTITGNLTIGAPAGPGVKFDGGNVSPFPDDLFVVGPSANVTLYNAVVTSGGGSGVAAIDDQGILAVENSTIAGNVGPGVNVQSGATATFRNSTIANGNDVGVIDGGTASFFNSTVAFNKVGGIDNSAGGVLNLTNTIVAKNNPTSISGVTDCGVAADFNDRSLDFDNSCGVSVHGDPKLGALISNLGPTTTLPLLAGSPAINAGDAAACPTTDQRYISRGLTCDIGADAYNATPPTINVPAPIVKEATAATGATATYAVTATSADDAVLTGPTCSPVSGATFAIGTTNVTCTSKDGHGNTGTATFQVTVRDTTAPVIAAHADVTAEATGAGGAPVSYTAPNATDAVKGTFAASCAPASGSTFGLGSSTVTCNASDAAGNAATPTTFSVIVSDTTAPVIAAHADVTATATGPSGAVVSYTPPNATDAVSGTYAATCIPASGTTFAVGSTTVTCSTADLSGNLAVSTTFQVIVSAFADTTPPVIDPHADITVSATSPAGAVVTYTAPNAVDTVDGTSVATCVPGPGATFAIGSTTVTCNASDAAGNAATPTTFKVIVSDTTAPVISGPTSPVTAEATGPSGAAVSYTVTASDATTDAAQITLSCSPASGSVFPIGSTTVTCNASDPAGNAATPFTFQVTVSDTTAPVIAAHADVTAPATAGSGEAVSYTAPNATDAVSGTFAATCVPASGSTFAVGSTTVTCDASDAAGNAATPTTFQVIVPQLVDTTPPVITVSNVTAEATSAAGAAVAYTATFSDSGSGLASSGCSVASGSVFPIGVTTVTCNAADVAGNTQSASFTVTVSDTTKPVIDPHANISTPATDASGAVVAYTPPNATDAVDGTFPATCSPASGSTFAPGLTQVTCNASDAAGNAATPTTFTVTVTGTDTTPPVITGPTSPVTREATGPGGANVSYTVSATDPDDPAASLTLSCSPATGALFPIGTTTVTCNAHDPAGNAATPFTFQVIVRDTTAPVFHGLVNIKVNATAPTGAVVSYTLPTATDLVSGPVTVTCSPAPGSTFPIGSRTVTCTARDAAGNTRTGRFTVSVLSARSQIQNLENAVQQSSSLRSSRYRSLRSSLLRYLSNADNALDRRSTTSACSNLASFITTVQANTAPRGPITAGESSSWVTDATRIRAVIGRC